MYYPLNSVTPIVGVAMVNMNNKMLSIVMVATILYVRHPKVLIVNLFGLYDILCHFGRGVCIFISDTSVLLFVLLLCLMAGVPRFCFL